MPNNNPITDIFNCTECNYKTNQKGNLRTHMIMHDKTAPKFTCSECEFSTVYKRALATHMVIHNKNAHKFTCDQCVFSTIYKNAIKSHKIMHDKNAPKFTCDQCIFSTIRKKSLASHMLLHDTNAPKFTCPQCEFSTIHKYVLPKHMQYVHDIGEHTCDICLFNRNQSLVYKKQHICRDCYKKLTTQSSRAETQMCDYLDTIKQLKPFVLGSDDNMKQIGGCSLYRPDRIYSSAKMVLHIECDENQHKYNNGSYACEEKRICEINEEIAGVKHIIVRWNPDNYKPNEGKKLNRQQRLERLSALLIKIIDTPPEELIKVYYMFYNADNTQIVKNIPFELIQ